MVLHSFWWSRWRNVANLPLIIENSNSPAIRTLEGISIIRAKTTPLNGTKRAVICCHGRGGDFQAFIPNRFSNNQPWALGEQARTLADNGYIVVSINAGGTVPWSNQTAMDAITATYNWLVAGRAVAKVGIMGWSMGGLTALNWTKRNQDKVARCVTWAAAVDLVTMHNDATFGPEIETAYGGAATWNANSLPFDPLRDFASYAPGALTAPISMFHSADDPTVPVATFNAFTAAANNPLIQKNLLADGGHSPFQATGLSLTAATDAMQAGVW